MKKVQPEIEKECKNCGHAKIAHSPQGKGCFYYMGKNKIDCDCKKFVLKRAVTTVAP